MRGSLRLCSVRANLAQKLRTDFGWDLGFGIWDLTPASIEDFARIQQVVRIQCTLDRAHQLEAVVTHLLA